MAFTRSTRPPHAKLGIEDGTRVLVLGVPPTGADAWPGVRVLDQAEIVVVGLERAADVHDHVPHGLTARAPDGRLWLAYRPGRREFSRALLSRAVDDLELDITWFRQVSLVGGWSAIWFRRRSEFRVVNH